MLDDDMLNDDAADETGPASLEDAKEAEMEEGDDLGDGSEETI